MEYKPELHDNISDLLTTEPQMDAAESEQMVWNLAYATAMARVKYYRDSEPLPDASDIPALAAYWKRVFNTPLGKGTEEEFINNYNRFVLDGVTTQTILN